MSTPRVGCKYVFVPVLMDRGLFPEGAVVTVVPMPGMPNAKVPSKFRYVTHDGVTCMVLSASLVPLAKYEDFSKRNTRRTSLANLDPFQKQGVIQHHVEHPMDVANDYAD